MIEEWKWLALVAWTTVWMMGSSAGKECMEGNVEVIPGGSSSCDDWTFMNNGLSTSFVLELAQGPRVPKLCLSDGWRSNTLSSQFRNYANGKAFCENNGGRLCTAQELQLWYMSEQRPNIGELFSFYNTRKRKTADEFAWTSTPCVNSATGQPGFDVMKWNGKVLECRSKNSLALQICCSSDIPSEDQRVCVQCPKDMSYKKNDDGTAFCSCPANWGEVYFDIFRICTNTRSATGANSCPANTFSRLPSEYSCSSTAAPWKGPAIDLVGLNSCKVFVQNTTSQCPSTQRGRWIDSEFAHSYCRDLGARLCSISELASQPPQFPPEVASCSVESGRPLWSQDECYVKDGKLDKGYFTFDHRKKGPQAVECVSAGELETSRSLGFRCCADNQSTAAVCERCNGLSTSLPGSQSVDSCQCPEKQQALSGLCVAPVFESPTTCKANMFNSASVLPCQHLTSLVGGNEYLVDTGRKVCSRATDSSTACYEPTTQAIAAATCAAEGARLCTRQDVLSGKVAGHASKCGNMWTRTSTPCCQGFDSDPATCESTRGHYGVSLTGQKEKCFDDDAARKFVCCADEQRTPKCSACPRNSKARGSGVGSLEERCSCRTGFYMDGDKCVKIAKQNTCRANQWAGSKRGYGARDQVSNTNIKLSRGTNFEGKRVAALTRPSDVRQEDGDCSALAAVPWMSAKATCEAVGLRLCTSAQEITQGLLFSNDGCGRRKNNVKMWTGKRCGPDSYWVTNLDTNEDNCRSATGSAAVVCCLDTSKDVCLDCPSASTSSGTGDYSSCICTLGVNSGSPNSNANLCKQK